MPKYAQADAVARLQKELLDPAFDAQDTVQISQLLTEILASKRRETELKQLKATLQYCLTSEQLLKYLEDHIEDAEFLAGPEISDVRRISRTDSSGIIDQCADRVYDIRCRIVHSKDSDLTGRPGPLLPLSDEATLLDADIALVEFLARHVLMKSGTNTTP